MNFVMMLIAAITITVLPPKPPQPPVPPEKLVSPVVKCWVQGTANKAVVCQYANGAVGPVA